MIECYDFIFNQNSYYISVTTTLMHTRQLPKAWIKGVYNFRIQIRGFGYGFVLFKDTPNTYGYTASGYQP